MEKSQFKKAKLKISGMHCASCEVLVERKFRKVAGIEKVHINHADGKAEIVYSKEPDLRELNELVRGDGYSVASWDDRGTGSVGINESKNTVVDYLQMIWIGLVLISLYFILKRIDFLPSFSISEHMSYGVIFLIGLFAAVSSCIAVVGGLLLALAGKYNEVNPGLTGIQKLKPHLYFNVGRIIGYTLFGALVGAFGSVLALSPRANGYLMVIVSAVMLMLGFQLLNLFPGLRRFGPKMPKFISHKIHDLSSVDNKGAPFTLGALTFFLPCGFTQALQLYVLAIGDWKVGALTMLTFALGTMPALFSLSAIASFAKGAFQKYFLRFAGVVVVLLAAFNINNGLILAGYNIDLATIFSTSTSGVSGGGAVAPIVDGKQIVKMKVDGYTYSPNKFAVIAGVPVEWQIDGAGAAGCGRVVVMPTLGISKYLLPEGITTITFVPTQTGTIPFNCSMGMMTRGSEFTVVPNTTGVVGAKVEKENTQAPSCDPSVATCAEAQKLKIEVSQERGIYPRELTVKRGVPVELTIDDKVALGGCMSVWVIPKYGVTIPMKIGVIKSSFTPTETGVLNITCSMGSIMAQINVID